ncbi:hypothetical protein QE152_g29384 [Popillia japonica]|uniref:Uncharacterized protein n=1 Tax=Popillia japonica TaxID=7064 RepID=A0AAW1JHF6_POPJA
MILIVPLHHIPTKDCERNFLSLDERLTPTIAMQKLRKKFDLQMNLMSLFQDYDRTNFGTISRKLKLVLITNLTENLTMGVRFQCTDSVTNPHKISIDIFIRFEAKAIINEQTN